MANDISVNILLEGIKKATGDLSSLNKGINDLGKTSKATQSILSGFKTIALSAGAALAGIFAGREMINAAMEKQDAINSLNATLTALGIYSNETKKDLIEFAEAIEKTTKYSNEQVIASMNILGALTRLDKDGLKKAAKTSMDLASTLSMDLSSASTLVAKAIEGNVGALGRYGIKITKGKTETENFNNTIAALSKSAGRAEKELNTRLS